MKRPNELPPHLQDALSEGRRPTLRRPSQHDWDLSRGCTMLLAALPLVLLFLLAMWAVASWLTRGIR